MIIPTNEYTTSSSETFLKFHATKDEIIRLKEMLQNDKIDLEDDDISTLNFTLLDNIFVTDFELIEQLLDQRKEKYILNYIDGFNGGSFQIIKIEEEVF
jgi:hypothetical protein